MDTLCAPVLVIGFNRPASCEQVLRAVREARPSRLFFAVDGPRNEHPTDSENCEKTKALVNAVDWPCEVITFFRETNRGCKFAPPEAITWFFSQVPAGIILEDDCVPTLDFLLFSSQLLQRYSDEDKIGMITGNNHYGFQSNRAESYHFSRHASIWGWASWKRAWNLYDVEMRPYLNRLAEIKANSGKTARFRAYLWRYVEAVQNGLHTWDIQWSIALLANNKLIVRPKCNLVANIGFTPDSTHTSSYEFDSEKYTQTGKLDFPLIHPSKVSVDSFADARYENRFVSLWRRGFTFIGAKGGKTGQMIAKLASFFERNRSYLIPCDSHCGNDNLKMF